MTRIKITEEMKAHSIIESKKRDAFINHHFEVGHLSYEQRDQLGFLGEFACCELLGIDWKKNIRENYFTIDDYDLIINQKKIDIKTETIPSKYASKIINKTVLDNELYGRRLINKAQYSLLSKYDYVFFSMFIREDLDYWYPIGFIDSATIIKNYPATFNRPDGGNYPFPASPVPMSILKNYNELKHI
jgi:hypothetical protein